LTVESDAARALHFRSIVIDTHVDTTQRLVFDNFNLDERHDDGSIDIPRMREGGVGAVFFAVWVPGTVTGVDAVRRALVQIRAVRSQVELHAKDLALAKSAGEIRHAHDTGRIAVLMGIEGGHMIHHDLRVLREFASMGVSYMTLTHTRTTDWADASTDKPVYNGLSDFGSHVIAEMNRLGMIVDISHVSDKTLRDVLEASRAPVLASHSSCRALCDAPRNLSDESMKAIAAQGGCVHINFHMAFVSQPFRDAERAHPELEAQIEEKVEKRCGENMACRLLESDRIVRALVGEGKLPRVEWSEIVRHVNHAVKVAGIDHVGLGSDFDGATMPFGMEDASRLPSITEALLREGYSAAEVQKILGGNVLRLMHDVETIGKSIRGTTV
jgi:membrane dipeptidase